MKIDKILLALLIVVFGTYIYTLAPTVVQIDAGELATAQAFWGTAHPTGYPLFTILGYLFVNLPLPFTKIYLSNLLAAVWTVGGVYYFYRLTRLLHGIIQQDKLTFSPIARNVFTIAAVLFFAFNKIVWLQSTSVEVYSLHLLLVTGAVYSLLKGYQDGSLVENHVGRFLRKNLELIIFTGLALANHLSIVFFIPGALILYLQLNKFNKKSALKLVVAGVCTVIIAGVFYLLMYFRAGVQPVVNWGDPSTLENLLFHLRGSQYSEAMFKSFRITETNFGAFIYTLPTIFAVIPLVFIFPGLIGFKRIPKPILSFLWVSLIVNIILAINYNIYDLMTYFILAYLCLHLFISIGIYLLGETMKKLRLNELYLIVLGAVAVFVGFYNSDVSHRDVYTFEDEAKSILNSLPKNAVVFSSMRYDWDFLRSPMFYFQEVEGIRKDIEFIDAGLMTLPWYCDKLGKSLPNLFPPDSSLLKEVQKARIKYLANPKDSANIRYIARSFNTLMLSLIQKTMKQRDVFLSRNFIDYEFQYLADSLGEGYYPIPDYYFYRVVKNPMNYTPISNVKEVFRFPKIRSEYINDIAENAANMIYERATVYEKVFGNQSVSDSLLRLIDERFPNTRIKPKYYLQPTGQ